LNDSLTSFRLVAVADADGQRFGSGSASIRVTQDLQLLAGLPPLVRTGDAFDALVTLRNTTAREMKVRATLAGTAGGAALAALPAKDVVVAAGAAAELAWPVQVPADADALTWDATAHELPAAQPPAAAPAATPAQDRVRVVQRIA